MGGTALNIDYSNKTELEKSKIYNKLNESYDLLKQRFSFLSKVNLNSGPRNVMLIGHV